ncbi:thiamine diphosphokinase [Salinicoccus sp. ID82-1]|uniref:Thiamine diphosphokinase n=1 Tax=Salinicoccus cyprini TaxID=2493691 RepID=A0A558AY30_9STAP|nr:MULTISPECIES: thiamine diphosphokinase [Salinicoccus]MCG1008683.1 thiamine diphosphokinase [Salinicoccus sp. ID82-1]TVT29160.1 thiamine diphosphokinase [Salinicoccus cyprini]
MHMNVLIREDQSGALKERQGEAWTGVDRGVYLLLLEDITPHYTYGDFDSVSSAEWKYIEERLAVTPVPSRKDDTDLEMCLRDLVLRGYSSIDVYGATGGRLDHMIGNIFMLMHGDFREADIRIIDRQNVMQRLEAGSHHVEKAAGMKYVSFIPYVEGTELTLSGFEYNLERRRLSLGATLTISNEFVAHHAEVHTDEPIIMIQSKDD